MNPEPAAEQRITLYPRRHANTQRGKALAHLAPAVLLLLGVAPVLTGAEPLTPLRGLEVAVGAAYLALMVRELRHLRHHPFRPERVAWLELAAAAILALEGYHIWHRHHAAGLAGAAPRFHVLPWLYAALAGVYAFLAFRQYKLAGRRFLHLHRGGFSVRTGLLGPACAMRWADVTGVEPAAPADLLVHRANGQTQRISFASVHEGLAHRARLLAHTRAQVAARPPAP